MLEDECGKKDSVKRMTVRLEAESSVKDLTFIITSKKSFFNSMHHFIYSLSENVIKIVFLSDKWDL